MVLLKTIHFQGKLYSVSYIQFGSSIILINSFKTLSVAKYVNFGLGTRHRTLHCGSTEEKLRTVVSDEV